MLAIFGHADIANRAMIHPPLLEMMTTQVVLLFKSQYLQVWIVPFFLWLPGRSTCIAVVRTDGW